MKETVRNFGVLACWKKRKRGERKKKRKEKKERDNKKARKLIRGDEI